MEKNAQALADAMTPVVDIALFTALSVSERWRIVRDLEQVTRASIAADARAGALAVPGRPKPKYQLGDYFRPHDGSTVYRVTDFIWEEGYGGYWRYTGYSERFDAYSTSYYMDRDVYYKCSMMRHCNSEGKPRRQKALDIEVVLG